MTAQDKPAAAGVVGAFVTWFAANIANINLYLQFLVLVAGFVGGVYSIIYYRKRLQSL